MSLNLPQLSSEVIAQLSAQGVDGGDIADMSNELLADGGVLLTFTLRSGRRVHIALTGANLEAAYWAAKALN